ncbi:nitroreductase family protein [Flammeovirga yaeyamensis]|uniref:Nitroreductase family protein n=2 Tax=Flammeovirgaceae TaxID=200667 RepID=A0AAX1NCQ8_9BACT|nr:nitroreductase family protein [Flammeovirga sp. MY04]ANQ51099.2 nitroreductase family protein [Flammeovirga sp. MY04]NMF34515.1 nitroreductase family protein [Flammeovirga yaeyamensis]QWG04010.1 nitroreductase family protein [Flammeovirga yaeyamensis]
MLKVTQEYLEKISHRRSLREFSDKEVPREVIENIIQAAGAAPSGANKQPWMFCAVSNPEMKKKIRVAAEKEEYEGYHGRMSEEWLEDLKPFGTDWNKPFLEKAPWLIVVFKQVYEIDEMGVRHNNYYVNESVGLACGFLLHAIHEAGLVALTHTPSPMNFLAKELERPANERPFLLIPVGYPEKDALVPNIERKSLRQISQWY